MKKQKDFGTEFYEKQEIARKIAKILADNNCTVSEAEEIIDMTIQNIKLSSVVRCFDLELEGGKNNDTKRS